MYDFQKNGKKQSKKGSPRCFYCLEDRSILRQQRRLRTTRHIMHSSAFLYESHEIHWLANYKRIKKRNM